jgi:hypothetical protein
MKAIPLSPSAFSVVYCVAYIVVLSMDAPLFRYYPLVGQWSWAWKPLAESGPGMAWYGLMALAGLIALPVAILWGGIRLRSPLQRLAWVPGVVAMLGCVYLMRMFFLR